MPQIALVSHEHDDYVAIGVIPQLFQPPSDILICLVFRDIVDKQRSDGAAIIGRCDGAIAFLAGGVPNLRFDGL